MDPLSDVLRAVRLSGAYFYRVEAAAPWLITTLPARELLPRVLPDAEHLISFHIVLSGTCRGGLESEEHVMMQAGDVIVFPHGDPHVMASANPPDTGLHLAASQRYADTVFLGPDGARDTKFVCGFLGCDVRPYNPLVAAMPRRLFAPGVAAGWLSHFSAQVVTESRTTRLGSETMLTRMAELMFIEVLRHHVERADSPKEGWLAGLVDGVVGTALRVMHDRPAHGWSLAELARETATSRTALSERFSRLVGISPMLYLKRWRLQLAAEQLSHGSAKVATIAVNVGYESEAAFSRAFKQETGEAPASWRRHQR